MNKLSYVLLLAAASAFAAAPSYAGDAAAGKTKAEACVDCHGEDGKGDDEETHIAGMSAADFTKAIQEYQNGARAKGDAKMLKAAKKLTPADTADLAAYYATLPK
jgi:cytochrome c553